MDWESVDERLVGRGETLSLEFLESYDEELKVMNRGKVGRPFTLTHSHIVFLAVVRYLLGFPSTFKRAFGEFCMAKTMKNITKELTTKALIYNMLANL